MIVFSNRRLKQANTKSQNQAKYRQIDYSASKPEMDFKRRFKKQPF